MEFNDLFVYLGEFRRYQIMLLLKMSLLSFFSGYQIMGIVFIAAEQQHWCEIDQLSNLAEAQQKYLAIPRDNLTGDGYSQCLMFAEPYGAGKAGVDNAQQWDRAKQEARSEVAECSSWIYDSSVFNRTITSQFDLVCQDSYKIPLISSVSILGILIGAPSSGYFSDRYGRKVVMLIGCFFHFIFTVAEALSPNYWWFVSFRFLLSVFNAFAFLTGFVMLLEIVGPGYRTLSGVVFHTGFSIGYMYACLLAFYIRDYRKLVLAMALPIPITTSYICLVDESPRWLISQQHHNEAENALRKIAKTNGSELPDVLEFEIEKEHPERQHLPELLTSHPILRRELLIILIAWTTNNIIYYGISFNPGALEGNIFLNTFFAGLVELPADIVCYFGMQYFGRKPTLASSYFIGAISSLICIPLLATAKLSWLANPLNVISKGAVSLAFSTSYIYSAELFPTPVRHLAIGMASMVSRIGGFAAPFIGGALGKVWKPLPSLIYCLLGVITGLLILKLPETLNHKLPDSFSEAEDLARGGRISNLAMDSYFLKQNSKVRTLTPSLLE